MTLHAGDVLDQAHNVRCTKCDHRFRIEGRHAAPECPNCGGSEFETESTEGW